MKIGIVGENGGDGFVAARVTQELSILTIDSRQMGHHFGETDNGKTGRVNDGIDTLGLQFWPSTAVECCRGKRLAEMSDESRGVHIARRFAGRDEKLQRGNLPKCNSGFASIGSKTQMSTQREPVPGIVVQGNLSRVTVGQFAERFRAEVIPLSNTFGYFCASLPMSEEVLKEYLEEPVAALPTNIAGMLPRISILLVPYLERSGHRAAPKTKNGSARGAEKIGEFVVEERPAAGKQSWASEVRFETETVLVFAFKEQDVAEYHYRLYRRLATLVADNLPNLPWAGYKAALREEISNGVHGEVDEESWQAKQKLLRRQSEVKRDTRLFEEYARQSFIDTLTLYLHGICCDIDVETGPRQLPSRHLRKRLLFLKTMYPPPDGYAVFPEDDDVKNSK